MFQESNIRGFRRIADREEDEQPTDLDQVQIRLPKEFRGYLIQRNNEFTRGAPKEDAVNVSIHQFDLISSFRKTSLTKKRLLGQLIFPLFIRSPRLESMWIFKTR